MDVQLTNIPMKKLLAITVIASMALSACNAGPRDEKQAYIDATIEATCMLLEAENIFDPAVEEQATEIYADYGFPVEDTEAMDAITAKYQEDQAVKDAVIAGAEKCAPEGFFDDIQNGTDVDVDSEDEADDEDAMVEDTEDEEDAEEAAETEESENTEETETPAE